MAEYHHPPPLTCFNQVWYNVADDVASVQFTYGTVGQQPFIDPDGWYWCYSNGINSPSGFVYDTGDPGGAFNHNYGFDAKRNPGQIVKASGVYPGSVQMYPP